MQSVFLNHNDQNTEEWTHIICIHVILYVYNHTHVGVDKPAVEQLEYMFSTPISTWTCFQ